MSGVLLAWPAAAQDDAREQAKADARALATEGYRHAQAGRLEEAIAAYRQAEQRFHAPTILLELARTHDRAGQLLEAQAVYRGIADEVLADYAPPDFFEAQKKATAELTALAPRIPSLRLVVEGAPPGEIQVSVDRAPAARLPDQPIRLNPGRHVVVAKAPGRVTVEREVLLLEGIEQRVVIVLEAPSAPPPRPPPPVRPKAVSFEGARPPATSTPPDASSREGSLLPAIVAFGAGGVGLGVGAVTGALALGKVADLDNRCPDRICEQADKEDHATARTLGTVSTIGFIAGGVGVAAGAVLLVLRPGAPGPERTGVVVGPGWIGVKGAL